MAENALQINELAKVFGGLAAVDGVSLNVAAGERRVLIGPNGAGKTTLLRMTTGLLRPDAGTVSIAGRDVWEDPATAKTRFGVVPDNPSMFERLTGRELIEFNGMMRSMDLEVIAQRRESLLRLLDLTEAGDTIVADYSLGMTKKIAIACALLHNPSVLFLDEPFAGVDPVARQTLEQILRRHISGGGTVAFSDHAMDVVERLCDRIMVIDHGRVLAIGSTAEITGGRRLQDVFVEMVGAQITEEGDLEWLGSSPD